MRKTILNLVGRAACYETLCSSMNEQKVKAGKDCFENVSTQVDIDDKDSSTMRTRPSQGFDSEELLPFVFKKR